MFFLNDTATTEIYTYCHTLPLHDALPFSGFVPFSGGLADFGSLPAACTRTQVVQVARSEEHTSELQSLMRNSYAVFCLKKKNTDRHGILYAHYQHLTRLDTHNYHQPPHMNDSI